MTSGRSRSAASTASSPSAASPDDLDPVLELEERAQPLADDRVVVDDEHADRLSHRADLQPDGRARAGRRADLERAAEPLRRAPPSTSGRAAATAARAHRGRSRSRRRSTSSTQPAVAALSRTTIRLAPGVAQRVLERLLGDAQHLAVARRRRRASSPSSSSSISACLQPAQHLDVLAQRAAEAVALEVGRAQLEDQRAQLVERLSRQRLQLRRPARAPRPGRARAASRRPRR